MATDYDWNYEPYVSPYSGTGDVDFFGTPTVSLSGSPSSSYDYGSLFSQDAAAFRPSGVSSPGMILRPAGDVSSQWGRTATAPPAGVSGVPSPQQQIDAMLGSAAYDYQAFLGKNNAIHQQFMDSNSGAMTKSMKDIEAVIDSVVKKHGQNAGNQLRTWLGDQKIWKNLTASQTTFESLRAGGTASGGGFGGFLGSLEPDTKAYITLGVGTIIFSMLQQQKQMAFSQEQMDRQNEFNVAQGNIAFDRTKETMVLGTDEQLRAQDTLAGAPLRTRGQTARLGGGSATSLGGNRST